MEDPNPNPNPNPCPPSVPVRRNPPRRAKTPASTQITTATATATTTTAVKSRGISAFPIKEILDAQVLPTSTSPPPNTSEPIRVFLRIKPLITTPNHPKRKGDDGVRAKHTAPTRKKLTNRAEPAVESPVSCLVVNDAQSVTLSPPPNMQEGKRFKSEVYDGFTHVFDSDANQNQVYEKVMEPLVVDFLKGKSGMVTAMGPTGSGKTHTIFGSPRYPGMLSLALTNIFACSSSSYSISMFEIYSERGKGEKLIDLSTSDGPDIFLQQSTVRGIQEATVRGLQEVSVSSVVEAEAVIARGMLKRATAMTNSNRQSSRSQCIINIRSAPEVTTDDVDVLPNNAVLTIADLAGAEREKKTGNQGTRLMESNFINNTSMVFGLCLRALLDHQKNPKKPLQKHFQNSLLTKYLRDYLEGKKRMALILTVKSGVEDYLDASFLLRQASPYMKIKFNVAEEPCQKRNISKLPREEKSKRTKLSDLNADMVTGEGKTAKDDGPTLETEQLESFIDPISPPRSIKEEMNECNQQDEYCIELERLKRNEQVMQKFSKAVWNVLKQYKRKLKDSEDEVRILKSHLEAESARRVKLEKEMEELKSHSLNFNQHSTDASSCTQDSEDEVQILKSHLEAESARCVKLEKEMEELKSHSLNFNQHSTEASSCTQEERSSGTVDNSDLSVKDLKQNGHQIYESSSVTGSAFKSIKIKPVEVEEDRSSAANQERGIEPSDLLDNSDVEQVLVGDARSPMEQRTVLGEEEMALPGSQVSPSEELGCVDTCNAGKSDSEHNCFVDNQNVEKSREHMPSSSISVKDIKDLEVENKTLKALPISKVSPREKAQSFKLCSATKIDSQNNSPCHSLVEEKPKRSGMDDIKLEVDNDRLKASRDLQVSLNEVGSVNACSVGEGDSENLSPCKSLDQKKPRRRLMPASSILLREINDLDLEDDERPMRNRVGRKEAAEERARTQGSISLQKLLNKLHI